MYNKMAKMYIGNKPFEYHDYEDVEGELNAIGHEYRKTFYF